MKRYLPSHRVRELQLRALANGGSVRPFADGTLSRTVLWKTAPKCVSPVTVELHGRRELMNERYAVVDTSKGDTRPNFLEMEVPCRRCTACLRQRAATWRYRAFAEYRAASRTWLATLTLSPRAVIVLLSRVRVKHRKGAIDFEALSDEDQFLALANEGFVEIQKWIKRLRKNNDAPFRYLIVTEAHKSGVPHWHLLIHEQDPDRPLRHKTLKGSWPEGFDSYKLIENVSAAGYVTKYLSKSLAARVRASLGYGSSERCSDVAKSSSVVPPKAEVTPGT